MAFTRISNSQINSRGATTLPNQPQISAIALKEEFDAPAKQIVAPAVNNLMDELEASTSANSLGAVAPTGRTGTTVQGVINSVSGDLATLEASAGTAIADAHTHSNKALLDTYTQTESDLASAVADDHTHSNKALLDTYTQTESDLASAVADDHTHSNKALLDTYTQTETDIADAVSKKHDHSNKALLDTYTQTETDLADAVSKKHTHSNKTVIDKFGEDSGGNPTYDGNPIGGGGQADAYKNIVSGGQTFVASGADTFKINAGSNVTITPLSGSDKGISISATGGGQSTGDMLMSDYDPNGTVKSSTNGITGYVASEIEKLDVSDSAVSGQYVSAVSETDGKISVTRTNLPTVPTKVSDLTNDSGYQTASDVATAISGKADTSSLGDLAYIDTDGVSSTKVLQGDGTWVTPSTGGHTMLPNPASSPSEADCINAINTAVAAGSTNDSVASEYTIGKWSNSYEKVAIVKATSAHPISTTGIGTWQDTLNSPTKADEQGWGWIEWSALHGIGSDNVDVKLTFDPDKCSVPITLGGYIIDDANDMMCIKFGNEITSADTETAWVGIKITITRTAATDITP